MNVYTVGEMFSGAGGAACGAVWAGGPERRFRHLWALDIDADACATLDRHRLVRDVICADVTDPGVTDYLDHVDVFVFCFPCAPFSRMGKKQGLEHRDGHMWEAGVRYLDRFQPLCFVAENVGGLGSTGALDVVADRLRRVGYEVTARYYRFEHYGVPQRRHRWVLVGFRRDTGVWFGHPGHVGGVVTAGQALSGISEGAANHERVQHGKTVRDRIAAVPVGSNLHDERVPKSLRYEVSSGFRSGNTYRKLDPDQPSWTVLATRGGGSDLYRWDEPRALTNRERARLQGFPDWWSFVGSRGSVKRQIGMAVPISGARAVFGAVLQHLDQVS